MLGSTSEDGCEGSSAAGAGENYGGFGEGASGCGETAFVGVLDMVFEK